MESESTFWAEVVGGTVEENNGWHMIVALTAAGIRCEVAAPSKLQRPAGDRVKTDARDAVHLARLLRMDEITSVAVPTLDQEAAGDLVRAREDCRGDLMRARHRLSKLLLRHGLVYYGGNAWTARHDAWLRQVGRRLEPAARATTFDADYDTVLVTKARRDRLDNAIEEIADHSEYTPLVRRLACLRGISTLTGFALAVEVGDCDRFTGNTIGSFVGLVPTEYSSGGSRVQGPITKTGNSHVRRLMIEAAWHHRRRYAPGVTMRARWTTSARCRRARGDLGNRRLHSPLGRIRRPPQEGHDRKHRNRPRADRLVLVPYQPSIDHRHSKSSEPVIHKGSLGILTGFRDGR